MVDMVFLLQLHCIITDFHADDDNYYCDGGYGDNDYDYIDNNIDYNSISSS